MNQDFVLALALPLTLFLMMFSMGTTLRASDFRTLLRHPSAVWIGLCSQLLLLPALAILILSQLQVPVELFVGFMILALSPGGTTSNLFSYLADGNVALSIALTAIVSLIAPFSLPIAANWLLADELADVALTLPVLPTVLRLLVVTLLPLLLGMLLRRYREAFCRKKETVLTRVPFVMLLGVIGGIVEENWANMPVFLEQTLLPALLLATVALLAAYVGARTLGRDARDARTIAIETSIQNGGTAMLVTGTILQNPAMTVAPIMYGILMLLPMFCFLGVRRASKAGGSGEAGIAT
ncbi:MAG: bile acid:sodium symporter [Pseudomonadota bacterium]